MALTATLDDVRGIGQPLTTPSGGGFLSGLAAFGRQGLNSLAVAGANADKKEQEAALNDTAQGVQDRFNQAEAYRHPLEDTSAEIPAEAVQGAERLNTAQKAVANGSMPQAAFDLHLETLVDDLYSKHPEKKAVIAQYLQGQGMDHYLFRGVKADIAAEDQAIKNAAAQEEFVVETAVKSGLVDVNASRSEKIAAGTKYLKAQTDMKVAKDMVDYAKSKADLTKAERELAQQQGNRAMLSASADHAANQAGAVFKQFSVLTAAAMNDPTGAKTRELEEAIPVVLNGATTAKSLAHAQYVAANPSDTEGVAALDKIYDGYIESIKLVHSGDLSQQALNQRVLTGMMTSFKIEAAQAYPLWMKITQLPGMSMLLTQSFTGGNPLPKEVVEGITKELQGHDLMSTDGLYHIQRVSQLLRGDLQLTKMDPVEAQKVITTVNTANVGAAKSVVAGERSVGVVKPLLTGVEQIADAAMTLSPNVAPASQFQASRYLSNPDTINALIALGKDPTHAAEAQATMFAVRGTAQHGIMVAKSGSWDRSATAPLQKLVWIPGTQEVKTVLDEDAYRRYAAQATKDSRAPAYTARQSDTNAQQVRVLTRQEVMAKPSTELQIRAGTINNYLNTVVRTYQSDPNIKGVTPRQAREAAFNGVPLETLGKKPGDSGDDFHAQVEKLKTQASNLTFNEVVTDSADRDAALAKSAIKFESDDDAIVRTALMEAGGQPSEGQAAVISTILNRMDKGDRKAADVVLERNQFEPWSHSKTAQEGMSIDKNSKRYQDMLKILQDVRAGKRKRYGFNNFYNPELNAQLAQQDGRRPVPTFDNGKGTRIGQHVFF